LLVAAALLLSSDSRKLSAFTSKRDAVDWSRQRADIEAQLKQTEGLHLVLVRYRNDHRTHHEWVYNEADIDHAKVVWARETPTKELTELLKYFSDRQVWLLEADLSPVRLAPYEKQAAK
jgi:hypothetical protein